MKPPFKYADGGGTSGLLITRDMASGAFGVANTLLGKHFTAYLPEIKDLATLGLYGAHDGNFFEARNATPQSLRDFGPMEFTANFHSLWIYSVANALGASGPVMTFADMDFGFGHALNQACLDIENGRARNAVITYLSLQNLPHDACTPEFVAGLLSSSPAWLKAAAREVRACGAAEYLARLFRVPA